VTVTPSTLIAGHFGLSWRTVVCHWHVSLSCPRAVDRLYVSLRSVCVTVSVRLMDLLVWPGMFVLVFLFPSRFLVNCVWILSPPLGVNSWVKFPALRSVLAGFMWVVNLKSGGRPVSRHGFFRTFPSPSRRRFPHDNVLVSGLCSLRLLLALWGTNL
jgi:hypothetical protein